MTGYNYTFHISDIRYHTEFRKEREVTTTSKIPVLQVIDFF